QTTLCTGNGGNAVAVGTEYQKLSVLTKGLRYPICQYQSFDAIFQNVAAGIITGAQLSCAFAVTAIPPDSNMNNTTLQFTPTNGGAVQGFTHVANAAACTATPNAFYTVNNEIHLCPGACTLWRNDPTAIVDVLFSCTNQVH